MKIYKNIHIQQHTHTTKIYTYKNIHIQHKNIHSWTKHIELNEKKHTIHINFLI